jgi:excisionase family DNA binding protein
VFSYEKHQGDIMKTAHLVKKYREIVKSQTPDLKVDEEEILTPREAAAFLRIGYKRLLNMSSNGQIPYHKLGRSNRYLKSDLLNLLLMNRKGA